MTDEELKQRAREFVEKNWEDVVADIDSLVKINSVEDLDHAEPGKPYGPAPFEALDTAVKIAARLGLDAHNCDGHIGYADVPGASPKQIATIGHTDIVPAGTGWTFEPFKVTRKDGYLIGRGVLDDKGPTTLSLYAAKFFADLVRETGEQLPYTLRCIIGNNEETEMADVEWYLDNFDQPEFLFSPDADFPLIYGEKGGWSATVTSKPVSDVIVDFEGGTVGNAVAGEATAVVRADASTLPPADRIDVEPAGEGLARLTAHGIGAHASTPQGSINAIGLLVDYLLQNELCSAGEKDFLQFERLVFGSTDGSTLGIACQDEYFDPLTCIGGTIATKDGHFEQTLDSRYPTNITGEETTLTSTWCRSSPIRTRLRCRRSCGRTTSTRAATQRASASAAARMRATSRPAAPSARTTQHSPCPTGWARSTPRTRASARSSSSARCRSTSCPSRAS